MSLFSPSVFVVFSVSQNTQTNGYIYPNIEKIIENFSSNAYILWVFWRRFFPANHLAKNSENKTRKSTSTKIADI